VAGLTVIMFLTKTLLLNWKLGEKYFATKLTDYDVASNNGNWQWISSSGADSQPYFRIFNPWSQGKECDPECIYIKKWVPELENVSVKDIHNWNTEWENYKNKDIKYSKPICNYEEQKEKALTMFRAIY
jgi:deoxyribodipyrimidine photo-lyase